MINKSGRAFNRENYESFIYLIVQGVSSAIAQTHVIDSIVENSFVFSSKALFICVNQCRNMKIDFQN